MRRALQIFIGAPSKHSHRHEREPDQPTSLTKVVTPQWPPRAQRHKERTRPLSGPRSRRQPIATAETPSLFELWSLEISRGVHRSSGALRTAHRRAALTGAAATALPVSRFDLRRRGGVDTAYPFDPSPGARHGGRRGSLHRPPRRWRWWSPE